MTNILCSFQTPIVYALGLHQQMSGLLTNSNYIIVVIYFPDMLGFTAADSDSDSEQRSENHILGLFLLPITDIYDSSSLGVLNQRYFFINRNSQQ